MGFLPRQVQPSGPFSYSAPRLPSSLSPNQILSRPPADLGPSPVGRKAPSVGLCISPGTPLHSLPCCASPQALSHHLDWMSLGSDSVISHVWHSPYTQEEPRRYLTEKGVVVGEPQHIPSTSHGDVKRGKSFGCLLLIIPLKSQSCFSPAGPDSSESLVLVLFWPSRVQLPSSDALCSIAAPFYREAHPAFSSTVERCGTFLFHGFHWRKRLVTS